MNMVSIPTNAQLNFDVV